MFEFVVAKRAQIHFVVLAVGSVVTYFFGFTRLFYVVNSEKDCENSSEDGKEGDGYVELCEKAHGFVFLVRLGFSGLVFGI